MPDRAARLTLSLAALIGAGVVSGDAWAAGGNVHVSGGSGVRATGDGQPNDIHVTQTGNTITVEGRNGTTVTAGPGATVDPNNPNRVTVGGVGTGTRVRIDTTGGDDVVEIDDLNVRRVDVKARAGDNKIDIDDTRTADKIEIETGAGDDQVDVTDSAWGRREVDVGGGTNTVNGIPQGSGGAGQVGTPPPAPTPNPPTPTPTPPGGGSKGMGAVKAPTIQPGVQAPVVPHVPGGKTPIHSPKGGSYKK